VFISQRGNLIEEPVEELFCEAGIPAIRTGAHNQAEIAERLGVNVRPAPDFVDVRPAYRGAESNSVMQAGRVTEALHATRPRATEGFGPKHSGSAEYPSLQYLRASGGSARRTPWGPVVRDTDGRVFTLATLSEMLNTEPFPGLRGLVQPER
jgi:hypothetical protein